MANWQNQSYYEILEVKPTAAENEIHEAYQRAKATYSTDSPALYTMFTPQEAQALNRLIEEAYAVLGNQRLRQAYDSKLEKGEINLQPEPAAKKVESATSTSAKLAVESGLGKTAFGTYKIDPNIENEITNQTQFDGNFLRKIREYKEVTLDNLADTTKINRSYLEAVEKNDFTSLPAPVFVRGFLAQMCRLLHLDERKVAKFYISLYKEALGKKK